MVGVEKREFRICREEGEGFIEGRLGFLIGSLFLELIWNIKFIFVLML